jgi:hypothetical protein
MDSDEEDNNNGRNQRPRLGAVQQRPNQPVVVADGLINQYDEAWMPKLPISINNLRVNSSETAQIRSIHQLFNPNPLVQIGGDDSDSDEDDNDLDPDWQPDLVILSQLTTRGLNYPGQFSKNLIGYITKIKLVNNVQVSQYQPRNNQGNRRQQVVPGQQRIMTFMCPQSAAGQNIFVVIQEKNNMNLFSNDIAQRDTGVLRKYLSLFVVN